MRTLARYPAFCAARAGGEAQSYPRLPPPIVKREVALTVVLAFWNGRVLVRPQGRPRACWPGCGSSPAFPRGRLRTRCPARGRRGELSRAKHVLRTLSGTCATARRGGRAAGGHARRGRGSTQSVALPHRAAGISRNRGKKRCKRSDPARRAKRVREPGPDRTQGGKPFGRDGRQGKRSFVRKLETLDLEGGLRMDPVLWIVVGAAMVIAGIIMYIMSKKRP